MKKGHIGVFQSFLKWRIHTIFVERPPSLQPMGKGKRVHRHGPYRFYAPIYDRFIAPSFSEGHSKMYESLGLKSGDRILEVGVGTGISLTFCPEFVQVNAIDFSSHMLKKARKRMQKGAIAPDVTFSQMDAHSLEFDDDLFDHSVVAHALAVVAEPGIVLEEMKRVTKSGGRITIVNHYKKGGGGLTSLVNPFRKRMGLGMYVEFTELIEQSGLSLITEERVNRNSSSILVCSVP